MKRLGLVLAILILTQPVHARQMIEDWVVDHFKPHGPWETICDRRMRDGALRRRCYIRYIDGYAPEPKFGASFAFVTNETGQGLRLQFGFEPGTRFVKDGFVLARGGKTVWRHDTTLCAGGNDCVLTGSAATALVAALRQGGTLRFGFTDRHGRKWKRDWEAAHFAAAYADYRAASAARDLP